MVSMMYQAYQNHMDLTAPWRTGAAAALKYLNLVPQGVSDKLFGRLAAALELISRTSLTYTRPAYGIDKVLVGNQELEVTEEVVYATPFGSLLHFKKENSPEQPRMLLVAPMSGHFAKSKPLKWFEENLINYVPFQCKGAFRQVYPGFIQLTAFVSMNLERHIKSHVDLADHLAKGEKEKAEIIKTFYDEYFAVMDLPADFYIETIRDVFHEHLLPLGKLTYRGRPVSPAAIKRMGLMTVEGEKDDICSIGQTLAAQDLCTGVRAYRKVHHMQAGVGHYGVFSGRRWNNEIYPLLRDFVHVNS